MKLTRAQVEARKEVAVRFVENVLGDSERADEIADEDLDSYAERKRIEIIDNPKRRIAVARINKTKAELEAEIRELQEENDELQDRLDGIADLTAEGEGEDQDEDEDDDSEEEDPDQD